MTAIARSQSLSEVLEHELEPKHFRQRQLGDRSPEPLPGEVYEWMLEHLRRFRSIPSMELLMMRFPRFEPAPSTDSIGSLMEAMMRQIKRTALIDFIREASDVADDPARVGDAETFIMEGARKFAREMPGSKVTRFSDALSMLDLYREREVNGFAPGISFSMDWLDELTYGVQTHEMAIIEGFLGTAKCERGDMRVVDMATGDYVEIQDLDKINVVQSFDEHDLRSTSRVVTKKFDNGVKDIVKVLTRSGTSLFVTPTHPIMTQRGWVKAESLEGGDYVARPRVSGCFGSESLPEYEIKLLAYLIGDGCLMGGSPTFTKDNEFALAEVAEAASHYDLVTKPVDYRGYSVRLSKGYPGGRNKLTDRLRFHGLYGKKSIDKRIPKAIFRLPEPHLALFLSRLFSTDGCAEARGVITYTSASRKMLEEIRHLLLRFGIQSNQRSFKAKCQTGTFDAHDLRISGSSVVTFAERIGMPAKQAMLDRCVDVFKREISWSLHDQLPPCVWNSIDAERQRLGWTWARLGRMTYGCKRPSIGQYKRGSVTRHRLSRFAEAMNSDLLREILAQEVVWDQVKSVTSDTPARVYDIEVPDTHSFVSEDIIVHNSSLTIRMCADAYFLRDETPMVFAFEMEAHKLVQKWIAMCAQFEYRAIKRGGLTEDEKRRWHEIGEKAVASKFEKDVIVIDDERRPTDDFIYSKIEQHRPSMAVVDTIDEVRAPSHIKAFHEKADYVARELKSIARATKVPMIVVAQAGRAAAEEGATIANIAASITIPRKADIVVGIHATEQMKANHMREFTLLKNRDDGGEGTKRTMYFHPGSMILRPWLPSDNAPASPSSAAA